jgi:hypothetical protein
MIEHDARALWMWLPARTDRRRHTDVTTAATALGRPSHEIADTLAWMERAGHAIRDRATGHRAGQWHRGLPVPATPGRADTPEALW